MRWYKYMDRLTESILEILNNLNENGIPPENIKIVAYQSSTIVYYYSNKVIETKSKEQRKLEKRNKKYNRR